MQTLGQQRFQHADLEREQGRLGHLGQMKTRRFWLPSQLVDHAEAGQRLQQGVDLLHRSTKNAVLFEQATAHARPLRAVARKQKCQPCRRGYDVIADDALRPPVLGELAQARYQRQRTARRRGQTIIVLLAPHAGGVDQVVVLRGIRGFEPVCVGARQLGEGPLAASADEQRRQRPRPARRARLHRSGILSKNCVSVRPAESERVDAHDDARTVARKRRVLRSHPEIQIREGDVGIRRMKMQGCRDCPMLQ